MEERLTLSQAAARGSVKDVKYWLNQDLKSVFVEDEQGWTPLFHAVANGQASWCIPSFSPPSPHFFNLEAVKCLVRTVPVGRSAPGGVSVIHIWASHPQGICSFVPSTLCTNCE